MAYLRCYCKPTLNSATTRHSFQRTHIFASSYLHGMTRASPATVTVLFLATALANISKSKESKYSGLYLRTKIRYNEWKHRGCQRNLNVCSSPSVVRASNVGLLLSRPSSQDAVIPCRSSDISSPHRSLMTKKTQVVINGPHPDPRAIVNISLPNAHFYRTE